MSGNLSFLKEVVYGKDKKRVRNVHLRPVSMFENVYWNVINLVKSTRVSFQIAKEKFICAN